MRCVMDTTALFESKELPTDFDALIPEGVLDELVRWGLGERMRMLLGVRIHIQMPTEESREAVRAVARRTGDIDRLSPTDIDVISLALELDIPIVSDDYSIQNVARVMDLQYLPVEERGIKQVFYWRYRCSGCGREYESDLGECEVCGRPLKPFRYRSEAL